MTWILATVFAYLLSFLFQILDFTYWTVLISIQVSFFCLCQPLVSAYRKLTFNFSSHRSFSLWSDRNVEKLVLKALQAAILNQTMFVWRHSVQLKTGGMIMVLRLAILRVSGHWSSAKIYNIFSMEMINKKNSKLQVKKRTGPQMPLPGSPGVLPECHHSRNFSPIPSGRHRLRCRTIFAEQ